MSRVELWFEFASTYSYPAVMRAGALAREAGVELVWRPFLLGPIFKSQGWNDSPFNLYPVKGRYMWRDLERICAELQLPFRKPSVFPRKGLLAARVAFACQDEPWTGDFVRAVYRANFAEDRDISDPEVVAELLAEVGQSPEPVVVAQSGNAKDGLRAQTERAQALGIFGAPSFVVDGELFWGNDRLEAALAWATRTPLPSSQFYTGLVAEMYDALVAHPAKPELYAELIREAGGNALELGCGTGHPLLALVGQGLCVEGLDSSRDMLAKCRERATALGLQVALHHQEMQKLDLPTRYRTIFLAGPSFTLLDDPADAIESLRRIYAHLEPGGQAVIPLFLPAASPDAKHAGGGWRERTPVSRPDGTTAHLTEKFELDPSRQLLEATLRYEIREGGRTLDALERPWRLRWYEQEEFRRMLEQVGFVDINLIRGDRTPSKPADFAFIARGRKRND
jgi:2-hydroxychromene-2-carboxylate isomerase/ubiquinone/menaquinone biosynthesis C-methylase UbiE